MSQLALGIDVSKDQLDVALVGGAQSRFGHFANTETGHAQLLRWLRKVSDKPHACLEATGRYGEGVATALHQQGYPVSVVNPACIKAYRQSKLRRYKSDKGDAEIIGLYCLKETPLLWTPLPESVRELQYLVRHRHNLTQMRQQERNRLHSGVTSERVRADLKAHIAFLDAQIKHVDKEIAGHIDQDPDLKKQKELLTSIPGIGKTTAAVLLGEVRDLRDFTHARQLAAHAGVVPEEHRSGSSVYRQPHLSKRGNVHLRRALYMPAMVARKHNPLMKALSQRMAQTGHCAKSILCAIMRKLLHLAYGVIKTGKPFDPNHAQVSMA